MRKFFLFFAGAALIVCAIEISGGRRLAQTPEAPGAPQAARLAASSLFATVVKVFDGDTIEITGGERVRYIGMDAPEEPYSRKATTTNRCYADEAKKENERLVFGRVVRLEKDVRNRDVYGRLLRYVYAGTASSEIFVNEKLVEEGFARAAAYPPDVKFKNEFEELQKIAKENRRGLWGMCK